MTNTVIGLFKERSHVEMVIDKLKEEGFDPKDISIAMRDIQEAKKIGKDTGADVAKGTASGATTGAVIGGLAGLLAATVLPGLGAFFIGGPLASALGLSGAAATAVSGAATGAAAGGLLGALMSLGLTREEAKEYEERVREGAILVAVPAREEEVLYVRNLFDDHGAFQVKTIGAEERRGAYSPDYPHVYATVGMKGGKGESTKKKGKKGKK